MAPLNESQRQLVEDHIKLAYRASRQCRRRTPQLDADDRDSIALEGLCLAAGKWEPEEHGDFAEFAGPRVWFHLLNQARREKPLAEIPFTDLEDHTPGPPESAVRDEELELLQTSIDRLPEKEREAVRDELDGLSTIKAGQLRGIATGTAGYRRRAAHARLKAVLADATK